MLLDIKTKSSPPALPTQDMSAASTGNNPPSPHSVSHSMPPFLHNLLHFLPLPMETGALALQSRWREWGQRLHGDQVLPSLRLTFRCWATQGGWRIRVGGNPCHDTHPSSSVWVSQPCAGERRLLSHRWGSGFLSSYLAQHNAGQNGRFIKKTHNRAQRQQWECFVSTEHCEQSVGQTRNRESKSFQNRVLNLIMEGLISMFIWIK